MTEQGQKAVDILLSALKFYANSKHWSKDDWGINSVMSYQYGNPESKAKNAINKYNKEIKNEK